MTNTRGLLILGFGGHARSVADIALASGFSELAFVDEQARDGETFLGFRVLRAWKSELPAGWQVFPATGDNDRRHLQCVHIDSEGWPLATLIAPTATCGVGSKVARGSLIAHQAHIGPMSRVGVACIVNTGAIVEHECSVGDFAHVSVNATVAGRSQIGQFSMVGAGATVIDAITVADHVIIGAGAVVCRSLLQAGSYAGVPARQLARKR